MNKLSSSESTVFKASRMKYWFGMITIFVVIILVAVGPEVGRDEITAYTVSLFLGLFSIRSFFRSTLILSSEGLLYRKSFFEYQYNWKDIEVSQPKSKFGISFSGKNESLLTFLDRESGRRHNIKSFEFQKVSMIAPALIEYKEKYG